jgi:hypothetical protein
MIQNAVIEVKLTDASRIDQFLPRDIIKVMVSTAKCNAVGKNTLDSAVEISSVASNRSSRALSNPMPIVTFSSDLNRRFGLLD